MSDRHVNDPDLIRELLTTPGRWAIVGLSANRTRPAFAVSRRIRDVFGQEIIPVNLRANLPGTLNGTVPIRSGRETWLVDVAATGTRAVQGANARSRWS